MRNAVYSGPWVTQAKRRFSKSNCVAYQLGRDYMAGAPIRQAYLETALKWISRGDIDAYMVKRRFDGDERHLDIRAFDGNTRREVYERQKGVCPMCGRHFELEEMEADHITPWRDGGRTIPTNCQMLCRDCNRRKGAK